MHAFIFFLSAPVAVLGAATLSAGKAMTGQLCCTSSAVPDMSKTCDSLKLNTYACESIWGNAQKAKDGDPDKKNGCDNGILQGQFPTGRYVKAFVPYSTDKYPLGPAASGDYLLGFLGCAE
ncbi:hypothetical protein PpBr36_02670 [Pyricularia pennisetigena]|uniref:hypothetical protein n=1 Tax=Pyricularia pennisetigena TaxID=1578925 RepID=UPI00115489E5|nr:hypothetical protein PpBr36_02670 [Pyricularia pennisetigena]TLS30013.1 hypothetical protein PpBr36_02670 [Pyricularia pennisetigena]